MSESAAKVLYIVVVDGDDQSEKRKESFRYTRPVLQSSLQLMGCKPRHAFKVYTKFLNFRIDLCEIFVILVYALICTESLCFFIFELIVTVMVAELWKVILG